MQIQIVDADANQEFREKAISMGLDPDDKWVGGYVEYEWKRFRHICENERVIEHVRNKQTLEFGCNFGASAIILSFLESQVTAIDIDADMIELARLNAKRYGVQNKIHFLHQPDTTTLPFGDGQFSFVSCNSVFEYIPSPLRADIKRELDRVIESEGILLFTGTSNRLWPKEAHSSQWMINYIPTSLDSLLGEWKPPPRGVFPWELLLDGYVNLDLADQGEEYLQTRKQMGTSGLKYQLLKLANKGLHGLGISVGLMTPNIYLPLQKQTPTTP